MIHKEESALFLLLSLILSRICKTNQSKFNTSGVQSKYGREIRFSARTKLVGQFGVVEFNAEVVECVFKAVGGSII